MSVLAASSAAYAGGPLPAAVRWVEGTIVGPVGTAVAVIAVALVGFALLSGRLSARQAGQAVLGCFILFGAPDVAHGLLDLARGAPQPAAIAIPSPPPLPPAVPPRPPMNPDPYAGASVPM